MAGDYWKTEDYFNPFPGLAAGLAQKTQRDNLKIHQQEMDQRALDHTSLEIYRNKEEMRHAADVASRLGVEVALTPDGKPDLVATTKNGILKTAAKEKAASMGAQHAMMAVNGAPFPLSPEQEQIAQTPDYQDAYNKVMFEDMREKARLRQAIDVQRERNAGRQGEVDENGNPIIISAGDKEFIRTPGGGFHDVTKVDPKMVNATDADGKIIPNVYKDPKTGKVVTIKQNSRESLFGAPSGGAKPAQPAPAGTVIRKKFDLKGKEISAPTP